MLALEHLYIVAWVHWNILVWEHYGIAALVQICILAWEQTGNFVLEHFYTLVLVSAWVCWNKTAWGQIDMSAWPCQPHSFVLELTYNSFLGPVLVCVLFALNIVVSFV